ncbi:hypothetical protein R6Z07F_003139 [Ovis aries]
MCLRGKCSGQSVRQTCPGLAGEDPSDVASKESVCQDSERGAWKPWPTRLLAAALHGHLLRVSFQKPDKSPMRRLGKVSNVAVLKTALHFILEQGSYTQTSQKLLSSQKINWTRRNHSGVLGEKKRLLGK